MKQNFQVSSHNLRGMDSNSLLRAYDHAKSACQSSTIRLERDSAEKAVQKLAEELKRRGFACEPSLED